MPSKAPTYIAWLALDLQIFYLPVEDLKFKVYFNDKTSIIHIKHTIADTEILDYNYIIKIKLGLVSLVD